MPVYTPIHPPSPPPDVKLLADLTPSQQEMCQKVLEHFSNDYRLPGLEKGELIDEEKFWLVSFPFLVLSSIDGRVQVT
jgi:hypothetical protein